MDLDNLPIERRRGWRVYQPKATVDCTGFETLH
jgi:hypothetical protein